MLGDLSDVLAGIAERAAGHDADGSFAFEAFDALWARGVLNLTIPAAAGGLGGGLAAAADVVSSVGAADPSVALVLSQHL
ncbi:MAG: acyl-CoA dehydrogenase family protein, partial [Ilumatobacteraceae bacterium]